MRMPRSRLILTFFVVCFVLPEDTAANPDEDDVTMEVVIHKYTGLRPSEAENMEQLNYAFEFCACNDDVFDGRSLPTRSFACRCSSAQKARKVINSYPSASFSAACTLSSYPKKTGKCVRMDFKNQKRTNRVYVKVNLGKITFTTPTWHRLPAGDRHKHTVEFQSAIGSNMSVTYSLTMKTEQQQSGRTDLIATTTALIETNNRKESATSFLASLFGGFRRKQEPTPTNKQQEQKPVKYQKETNLGPHKASPPTTSLFPFGFDVTRFRRECLDEHNFYRENHDSPPLEYDTGLEVAAQRWADHLADMKTCLQHEQPRTYGENLFYFGSTRLSTTIELARASSRAFYIEGDGYNYKQFVMMSYFKNGHFTQMIWKSSRRMGVGIAIRRHDGIKRGPCQPSFQGYMMYVCIKYDPAGNRQTRDAYFKNVLPVRKHRFH